MQSESSKVIDWTTCVFCQKKTKVKTVCPGNSKRSDAGCGYKTLSDVIHGYLACGELPVGVNTDGWDEGGGIEATFKRDQACGI